MRAAKPLHVGGAINPKSSLYLTRPHDVRLNRIVDKEGCPSIEGARQLGKTSSIRYLAMTLEESHRIEFYDVAQLDDRRYPSAKSWLEGLRLGVQRLLGPQYPGTPMVDREMFDLGQVLEAWQGAERRRCWLFLDEIDAIRNHPEREEIIQALKSAMDRQEAFKIGFCSLRGLAVIDFRGVDSSFALGETVRVEPFPQTDATVEGLLEAFSEPPPHEVVRTLVEWTGGHPLLTIQCLQEMIYEDIRTEDRLVDFFGAWADPRENAFFEKVEQSFVEDALRHRSMRDMLESLLAGGVCDPGDALMELASYNGAFRRTIKGAAFSAPAFEQFFRERYSKIVSRINEAAHAAGRSRSGGADKRVAIINTGGTIGMIDKHGVVESTTNEEFRRHFPGIEGQAEFVEYDAVLDSINVATPQWIGLIRRIHRLREEEGFESFVVLHGTDTMAFTACAMAMSFGRGLTFPIVFTGAQATPDLEYADAHANLYRACKVAQMDFCEVVICFGDYVFRAVRAQKKDDRFLDGFESPTYPPLMRMASQIELNRGFILQRGDREYQPPRPFFADRIFQFLLSPGIEPEFLRRAVNGWKEINALVIVTLGAGNIPFKGPFKLDDVILEGTKAGVPVLITSQHPPQVGEHTKYLPAQSAISAGGIHTGNMTLQAAIVKLRWTLGTLMNTGEWNETPVERRKPLIESLMLADYVGELDSSSDAGAAGRRIFDR